MFALVEGIVRLVVENNVVDDRHAEKTRGFDKPFCECSVREAGFKVTVGVVVGDDYRMCSGEKGRLEYVTGMHSTGISGSDGDQ